MDWLDTRTGVRELYQKHAKYPLPEGMSFWSLFGGMTIGCVLIQFLTGFYMLSYYIPEPELAHESIKTMCNTTAYGALFRNIHRYSATFGAVFLLIHAFHVMARRAFRPPRELNWWSGLLLAFSFILLLITGIIMPWDWRSYWELIMWTDWVATIPLVGGVLKQPMLSHFTLGWNFAIHIILLPLLISGLIAFHIALFRRLGMSERV